MLIRKIWKLVKTEDQLLALLGEAPSRIVEESYHDGHLYIMDGDTAVARIADIGPAASLLDRATEIHLAGDRCAWRSLPLHYGPCCSQWCLPIHPQAPTGPKRPDPRPAPHGGAHALHP